MVFEQALHRLVMPWANDIYLLVLKRVGTSTLRYSRSFVSLVATEPWVYLHFLDRAPLGTEWRS